MQNIAPFDILLSGSTERETPMQIEKFSKITLEVTVDGKRYSVKFAPESFKPVEKRKVLSSTFDPSLIKTAIVDLGYDDSCVNATAINKHLGGDVPSKTIGYTLSNLCYDESVRYKGKDGVFQYVRYNSFLVTAKEAVERIKGL